MGVRIIEAEYENFIGIWNGLRRKNLKLDMRKFADKDIILIEGGNMRGKTTLASILHGIPGTSDARTKFIREGKHGYERIHY